MPTVPVYVSDELYGKLQLYSEANEVGIGKAIQLIVDAYFRVLESQGVKYWQKGNTEMSTNRT